MGLEEVTNDILDEAQQKSNQIIDEAEKEAEAIVQEAEEKAEKIEEKAEEEIEEKKDSLRKKALSNARMKARGLRLQEKQAQLDSTFKEFRESISELDKAEREVFVDSCIKKAGFEVGKVKGPEEFENSVTVSFEQEDIDGIILVSEDGERQMDFTFDRIVKNYRENMRKEVSEVLFTDQ